MQSLAGETIQASLLIASALFPIVNPLGNSPIFLSLTSDYDGKVRTYLAWQIAINGFVLLIASLLIGAHILAFFGISLPVVQVGGGLLVIATGWQLLQQDDSPVRRAAAPVTQEAISKRAFYPLTLPLTVGPGSISVAITLGANQPQGFPHLIQLVPAVLGSALIGTCIYLSYRFAERIAHLLGETAMSVVNRLSSFILLCIGVQIAANGVVSLLAKTR